MGYGRGTITPFGIAARVAGRRGPADPRADGFDRVCARGVSATVDGGALVLTLDATVADVTEPDERGADSGPG